MVIEVKEPIVNESRTLKSSRQSQMWEKRDYSHGFNSMPIHCKYKAIERLIEFYR